VLLIAFVPGWYLIIGSMMRHTGAPFLLRATGTVLVVDGHDLTLITAGLSAITLITGFVVFAATRRALPFDRRLILSGYRPGALIAAKTTAALAVAAAVGAYAALVILVFWRPPARGPSRWRSSWPPRPTPRSACSSACWSAVIWRGSS
jgi:ABC-2 type transport system permease protein